MWQLVYYKSSGKVKAVLPIEQPYNIVFQHYPDVSDMDVLIIDEIPEYWRECYVENGELKRRSQEELEEIMKYGRVLTEEERLLEKLKPSLEEVRKAENTIEILTLIQEVI